MVKKVADSAILKKARKLIETGEKIHLCFAIGAAAGKRNRARGNALISWVEKTLGVYDYYSQWLRMEHPQFYTEQYGKWQMNGRRGSPWKEGRLQWPDWMIAECEKEETVHG